MSKTIRIGLAVFVLAVISGLVFGQCRNGQCEIPSPQILQLNSNYQWKGVDGDPDRIYLFSNNTQIGGWDYKTKVYRAYDANTEKWGLTQKEPPYPLPVHEVFDNHVFGVSKEKLVHCNKCTHKGKEVSIEDAIKIISDKIPDDSKKFRLTVIGSKEENKAILEAYGRLEQEIRDKTSVWYVQADNFALKDTVTGKTIFKNDGHPTVYFQAPNGKVLHRQDDWKGEGDFVAIRKAVKDYNPTKDPDLRQPQPNPVPNPQPSPMPLDPKNPPTPLWVLIVVGILAFLANKLGIKLPQSLVLKK